MSFYYPKLTQYFLFLHRKIDVLWTMGHVRVKNFGTLKEMIANFAKHQQERISESDPRTKETSNKVKYQSMNDR